MGKLELEKWNEANVAKWVAGLRSGKWEQGQGKLRETFGRLCCLGVACEVAIADGLGIDRDVSGTGFFVYDGEDARLPTSVGRWLGTGDVADPVIGRDGLGNPLSAIECNDGHRWSFEQIADAVEVTVFGRVVTGPNVVEESK